MHEMLTNWSHAFGRTQRDETYTKSSSRWKVIYHVYRTAWTLQALL